MLQKKSSFERDIKEKSYLNQYKYFSNYFIKTQSSKFIRTPKWVKKYLKHFFYRLELFKNIKIKDVLIYKSNDPFYFSMPNGYIVISSSVFKNYILEEGQLLSILLFEGMKIQYNIYKKIKLIPTGEFNLMHLLKINNLPIKIVVSFNNLLIELFLKLKFDPSAYLRWIQVKNKNILHFSKMYSRPELQFREEYFFKITLVKYQNKHMDKFVSLKKSSKMFYKFKNWIRRR